MSEFSRVSMLIDINQLKNKTVAIVGIGGVGGYVAESLARSGVGKLILVDYDVVDETNINRQIIALHSTIGKEKVSLMEERIHDICEDTQVVSYRIMYGEENRYDIFSEKIDFLVDACDIVRSKQILITECLNRGIPFISSMGTGNRLDPSKLTVTDLAKTEGDPLARIMRKWAKDRGIRTPIPVLYSSELPIKTGTRQPGSLIFVPASAGLLIGSYIVRYFLSN
ncbi:MAG: tRNA threonylcarbamoyladenosine dehydratase [Bacillota bacterium]|nr:MAG: tRNA threonylcarbamoyladenosine dehydratase [Bacillota bacterium]